MSSDAVIFVLAAVYWVASFILGRRKKKARKEALKRQESAPVPATSQAHTHESPSNLETVSRIAKALGIYVPEEISPLPPPTYYEPVLQEKEKLKRQAQVAEKENLTSKKSLKNKEKRDHYSVTQKTSRMKLSLLQVKKGLHLQSQLKKAIIFKAILDPPPSAHRRRFIH